MKNIPAFPRTGYENDPHVTKESDTTPQEGMSMEQWYTGMALIGLLQMGSSVLNTDDMDKSIDKVAELARKIGKAMVK